MERQEHANGRFLAVDHTDEVPHVGWFKVAAMHRENHLFGLSTLFDVEVEPSINSLVSTLFLLIWRWPRTDQTQKPPLEFGLVQFGQGYCAGQVGWFPKHLVLARFPERSLKAVLDESDCQMSNIYPDPPTT